MRSFKTESNEYEIVIRLFIVFDLFIKIIMQLYLCLFIKNKYYTMIILYEFIYLEIWLIKQIKWKKTLSKGKIMYTKKPQNI